MLHALITYTMRTTCFVHLLLLDLVAIIIPGVWALIVRTLGLWVRIPIKANMFVKIAAWCGVWALIEHWDCGLRKKNFYDTECRPEHVEK